MYHQQKRLVRVTDLLRAGVLWDPKRVIMVIRPCEVHTARTTVRTDSIKVFHSGVVAGSFWEAGVEIFPLFQTTHVPSQDPRPG